MISFVLLIILLLPGEEPKIQQIQMPNLETCELAAHSFMTSEDIAKVISNGGVRQAACGEIVPRGNPA